MAKQIIQEKEKELWHDDLDSLLAQSGGHWSGIVANRVDQLITVDMQRTMPNIVYAEKLTLCVGRAALISHVKS